MSTETLRRFVYGILITITASMMVARIIGVERVFEPSTPNPSVWPDTRPIPFPTFGSNDRSRWATIRALVERGEFSIGQRIQDPTAEENRTRIVHGVRVKDPNARKGFYDDGIGFEEGYKSVDIVKDPKTEKFYSSKPPLYSVIVAGEYWLIFKLGGDLRNSRHRWPIVCAVLITFNVLPLIVVLILLARLLEEYAATDWGRLFVFAAACFGTFMTTFAVTLNNHTPAGCCAMFAIYPLLRGRGTDPARPFTPCELLVSGFFAGLAACLDLPAAILPALLGCLILFRSAKGLLWFVPALLIPIGALVALNYSIFETVVPVYSKKQTEWYKYPGSHWLNLDKQPPPPGIDFANEPKQVYAFHMVLGHHGVLSLTPIWLLALSGALYARAASLRLLGKAVWLMAAVVTAFYIWKTNNYEGWTSGPRWIFWLSPLFTIMLIPCADRLGESRCGRCFAYLLLAVSVFSAVYPVWNPWRHPWPYILCEYMNWVKY